MGLITTLTIPYKTTVNLQFLLEKLECYSLT